MPYRTILMIKWNNICKKILAQCLILDKPLENQSFLFPNFQEE